MFFYILIFSTIFVFSISETLLPGKSWFKQIIYWFFAIVLICFSGLRFGISSDYTSYKEIYTDIAMYGDARNTFIETGYKWLNLIFTSLGFSFETFLFTFAFISISLKLYVLKKYSPLPILSLLLYFVLFFILFDMGAIRRGMAASLVVFAFFQWLEKNKLFALVLILIAISFHVSAICFVPFLFIKAREITFKNFSFLLLGSLIFMILSDILLTKIIGFGSENFIYLKLINYLEEGDNFSNSATFSLGLLIRVFFVLILILNRQRLNEYRFFKEIMFLYAFSICVLVAFDKIRILSSIQIFFKFYEVILAAMLIYSMKLSSRLIYACVICCYLLFSLISLLGNPLEPDYIPYKSIITE